MAALPGPDDRLALFDQTREIVASMAEAIDKATPEQTKEMIGLLIQRVVIRDRQVARIEWRPEARPFFERDPMVVLARPAGLEPTTFRSAT